MYVRTTFSCAGLQKQQTTSLTIACGTSPLTVCTFYSPPAACHLPPAFCVLATDQAHKTRTPQLLATAHAPVVASNQAEQRGDACVGALRLPHAAPPQVGGNWVLQGGLGGLGGSEYVKTDSHTHTHTTKCGRDIVAFSWTFLMQTPLVMFHRLFHFSIKYFCQLPHLALSRQQQKL